MSRHAPKIELTEEEDKKLKSIVNSRSAELRQIERATIILACAEGNQNQQVAQETGFSEPTVSKWRSRFAKLRFEGLKDAARCGKPVSYGKEFRHNLLALLEQKPPDGLARWDSPELAEQLKSSVHAVWRALRKEGIYLHRSRSWCISADPEFTPKAAEIVGLYLDPPENALILSVDEKPGIQAIERPTGYVETRDGKLVRAYKSTYKRNGTLNLFAALEVATGYVHTQTTSRKKREDFLAFLDSVLSGLPSDKEVHVILDNYCTHKKNEGWLQKYDNRVKFHFTPTSASWLNQVEIWFNILSRKTLRGASFDSTGELAKAIAAFVCKHNKNPEPFKWRKREVKGSQLRNTITNLRN